MIHACDIWLTRTADTLRAWIHPERKLDAVATDPYPATADGLHRLKADLCDDVIGCDYRLIDELTIPEPDARGESVRVEMMRD